MHRFLPSAREVAAEHACFMASLVSKNHSEAPSASLPQQCRRTPITHHMKSRAQRDPKGYAPSCPVHLRHQDDSMPHSMSSCGFFCLGLKNALFCAHCPISASGCSMLRKKTAHTATNHLKVADKGTSLISSEVEGRVARKQKAMGGVKEHQSGINEDIPILHPLRPPDSTNGRESSWRCAYHASFSRRGFPSSDGCTDVGHNPPLSQSGKVNLVADRFENMKSIQRPHDDHHVSVRKFVRTAQKEQDNKTVQEGVAPSNQNKTLDCVCDYVENLPPHDRAGENMFKSTLRGLETSSGKSAHDYNVSRSSWQDGDDDEDDEPQLFDALSTLSSVKSDASSHFETPCTSTSEDKLVPSHVCAKGMSTKMSSLSQRGGKGVNLENEIKQAKSPRHHDPCAYDRKLEPQHAETQARRLARLRRRSLDSMSGFYLSKAIVMSPVFPAKCQRNTANASGWPFGISSQQSSPGSPYNIQHETNIEKHVVGGNVLPPPLPPSPTEPWLGKAVTKNASKPSPLATLQQQEKVASAKKTVVAVTKNASKPSPLATLQQQEKVASAKKTVDFISVNPDAERRWEDVVKRSRVHRGHLRYSEELEILMLTSL